MKKITSIIVTAALIAGLAGCNKTGNSDSSNDSTSTSIQTNATESTESTESTDFADSEPLSDDVKRLIEEYPCVLDFLGQDGTVLPLSDITHIEFPSAEAIKAGLMNTHVTYGLAYMSYGSPVFATSLDNDDWKSDGDGFSDVLDWLRCRRDEAEKSFSDHNFFMVKPGDKLENGLVVKSAETDYTALLPAALEEWNNDPFGTEYNPYFGSRIEFDGTLNLEGVLYKYEGDPQYFSLQNDVFFYPDTTKNEFVPMYQTEITAELLDSDVAVIHDGWYYLGNLDGYGDLPGVDYDVNEIFGDKNYVRVKITLKDICVGSVGDDTQSPQRAKIADIERMD